MIVIKQEGSFKNIERFFKLEWMKNIRSLLDDCGRKGVEALSQATPKDSGRTADRWTYSVRLSRAGYFLSWNNSNTNEGVPIAIVLQYGHATRSGGFVEGVDYINPTIKPIFEQFETDLMKEVRR